MRKLLSTLESLDNISPTINLTYNNQTRAKTPLGGAIMAVIISLFSLGFIYFSIDMVMKRNPITSTNAVPSDKMEIDMNDYPLSFTFTDYYGNEILEGDPVFESLEILAEYWETGLDENGNMRIAKYFVEHLPCPGFKFAKYTQLMEKSVSQGSRCLNFAKLTDTQGNVVDKKPIIASSIGNTVINFFQVKVKLCDEKKRPGCRKAYFDKGGLDFYIGMFKNYVNHEDYEDPVKYDYSVATSKMSPGMDRRQNLMVQENIFEGDDGIILKNTSTTTFYSTELGSSDVNLFNENTRRLFMYTYRPILKTNKFIRRYVKLQEILANLGGFLKAIMLFGSLINRPFSKYRLFKSLGKDINEMKTVQRPINNYISGNESKSSVNLAALPKSTFVDVKIGFWSFLKESILGRSKKHSYEAIKYLDLRYLIQILIDVEKPRRLLNINKT